MATSPVYHGNFSDREQPTYNTVADCIADARVLLQDVIPPYRYDDPSLLTALNVSMLEAARLRADLFVFNTRYKGQVPSFQAVDDTYVELEPVFRTAIVNGLCGHALTRDQEDYQDARATAFLNMFSMALDGRQLYVVAGGSGSGGQR